MANIVIINIFFFYLAILLAKQPVAGMKRQRDDDGGPADPNDHHQSVKGGSSSVPEIPAQQEGPKIVYIEKPKEITVDAADFKPIVQRLTVNSEHQQEANVNNNEQGMLSSHGRPLTMGGANSPIPPQPPSLPSQQIAPFIPSPSPTNINSVVDRGKRIVSVPSIHHSQPASSLFSQLQRQQRLLHTTMNSAMFSSVDQQPFNQHVMQQQQQIGDQQIHQHHLQQQNRQQQQQQFAPFMPPPPSSTNINRVDRGKSIVSVPPIHNKQPEFSLFSQYLQQQQQHSSPDKQLFNQQVMQQQQHFSGGEQQLLAQQHHNHPYQLQQNPIHRPTPAGQQQQQPFQPLHNPRSASTLPTRHTLLSLQQSAVADRSQQLASSMLHASKAMAPEPLPLAQRMLHIEPSHHLMFLLPSFKEDGSGSSAVEDKFIELTNRSGQQSLMFKLSSTNNRIFHFSISLPFHPADQFHPSPVGLQYRPASSVGLLEPGQSCFVRVRLVLPAQNAASFAVHLYENMNNLKKKSYHHISIYHRVIENSNNNNDDIALLALEQWKGIDDERVSKWELAVLYEKKSNNNDVA